MFALAIKIIHLEHIFFRKIEFIIYKPWTIYKKNQLLIQVEMEGRHKTFAKY